MLSRTFCVINYLLDEAISLLLHVFRYGTYDFFALLPMDTAEVLLFETKHLNRENILYVLL